MLVFVSFVILIDDVGELQSEVCMRHLSSPVTSRIFSSLVAHVSVPNERKMAFIVLLCLELMIVHCQSLVFGQH